MAKKSTTKYRIKFNNYTTGEKMQDYFDYPTLFSAYSSAITSKTIYKRRGQIQMFKIYALRNGKEILMTRKKVKRASAISLDKRKY